MPLNEFESYYRHALMISEDEFGRFMDAIRTPLPSAFRITNRPSRDAIVERLKRYPFLSKAPFFKDVYTFNLRTSHELYNEFIEFLVAHSDIGNIQRQEVASMLPYFFTQAERALSILETCAAPGSKTKQLLESYAGLLVSNDRCGMRANVLVSEASKMASFGFVATHADASIFPNSAVLFDRVCCDVPCSSDGTIRKNPAIRDKWSLETAFGLFPLQKRILERALSLLKPDGFVIYSTCSFNPIENEFVISQVLENENYELCTAEEALGINSSMFSVAKALTNQFKIRKGITAFNLKTIINSFTSLIMKEETAKRYANQIESIKFENKELEKCIRLMPQDQNTSGFFIAVIKKKQCVKNTAQPRVKKAGRRFIYYDVPGEILDQICKKYGFRPDKLHFISRDPEFKKIYCLDDEAYKFIQDNPNLSVSYAGVKAFEKTDIGVHDYRPKSSFMDLIKLETDVLICYSEFIKLLTNKEVKTTEMSFTVENHFTASVEGLNYRFAGFSGKNKLFLYINKKRRNALCQLYCNESANEKVT